MALVPADPTKAQAWLRGSGTQADPFLIDLYVPRGNKGDPGGITLGTALGTADLDEVRTSGVYRQDVGTNISLLRNYPTTGETGVLIVHSAKADGSFIEQQWIPADAVRYGRVTYQRSYSYGVWRPWRAFASQRVDQTAGRAVYSWDDVNNREQLVYGDTGLRNIAGTVLNGWTVSIATLRRVNSTVSVAFYLANPAAKTDFHAFSLPVGFRPSMGGDCRFPVQGGAATTWALIKTNGDLIPDGTVTSGTGGMAVISFPTNDPWPTTLPGASAGSIPSA